MKAEDETRSQPREDILGALDDWGESSEPPDPEEFLPIPAEPVAEATLALSLRYPPESDYCFEIRAKGRGTTSGYYHASQIEKAARDAISLSGKAEVVWATLNAVKADCCARADGRLVKYAQHTTTDADVVRRLELPIDADPVRASGISSTHAEHAAAIERIRLVVDTLRNDFGFPAAVIVDSGNGAQALYRYDLQNNDKTKELCKAFLETLSRKFSDATVIIDKAIFNAGRVFKLPGTLAMKGDSTDARPHRVAHLLEVPVYRELVTVEMIQAVIDSYEPPKAQTQANRNGAHPYRALTEAEISDALTYVGNVEDRENWLHIGMALKSEFGEAGRPLWDTWARVSAKFDPADQDKTWQGLTRDGGISIGTLIKLAKDGGWPGLQRAHAYQRQTESNGGSGLDTGSDAQGVVDLRAKVVRMEAVEAEKIQWLWKAHIALGKITLMAGDPGLGKSVGALDLAAITSTGGSWPDGVEGIDPSKAVILSAEDGIQDTIKPRLDRAGADMKKIRCIDSVQAFKGKDLQSERALSLITDMGCLREVLTEEKDVRLVIVDPLSAYLGGTDTHKDAEVRDALTPLASLANHFNVAILVILHLNKAAVQAIYRVSGSVAFTAIARAVFAVAAHPKDKDARLFVPIKNNLAPLGPPRVFHIDPPDTDNDQRIKVVWGNPSELTKDEIFDASPGRKPQGEAGKVLLNEGKEFLRDFLAAGPKLAKEVADAAKAFGVSSRTLRRAREALGFKPAKEAGIFNGRWFWQLPAEKKDQKDEN